MDLKILDSFQSVGQEQWRKMECSDFPFLDFSNLSNYEGSKSVGVNSGWIPRPITLWDEKQLVAACPCYIKYHSYGEYIFDWEWAQAYENYGLSYYPKAVAAVPFTPATGPKLLGDERYYSDLITSCEDLVEKDGLSGFHFLFLTQKECSLFSQSDWVLRHSFQFHWHNQGYSGFGDFLGHLKSKRRKEILREREMVKQQGIQIEILENSAIQPEHLLQMFNFYQLNTDNKWGTAYLSQEYFEGLINYRQNLVLAVAKLADSTIAMSLSFKKGSHLFGRYWGSDSSYDCLHFELCYYTLIDYAIEKQLSLFEAGAQGPHKINRGFLPQLTYSAHYLADARFRPSISRFVEMEKRHIAQMLQNLKSPYK